MLHAHPPHRLYHYTSADGLAGILASRVVWASAVQFLNDAREFRLAIDIAEGVLAQRAKAADSAPLRALLSYYHHRVSIAATRTVCVFSLSEEPDLLSQWRGYCPSSGGYSLGLSGPDLKSQAAAHGCQLAKCVYDPEEQRRLVWEAVESFLALLPHDEIPGGGEALDHFADLWGPGLFHRVAQVAPLIKHYSFSEEKEWRIIWTDTESDLALQFRPARSMFVPYVSVPIVGVDGRFPTFDVVVGPMPHQQLAHDSLTGYLMSKELNWGLLSTSCTPYRNW